MKKRVRIEYAGQSKLDLVSVLNPTLKPMTTPLVFLLFLLLSLNLLLNVAVLCVSFGLWKYRVFVVPSEEYEKLMWEELENLHGSSLTDPDEDFDHSSEK